MAYQKSLSDTVSEMKKHRSLTLDWDVVVNYSVASINKLLKETFNDKQERHITELNFDVCAFDDHSGNYYTIHYHLGLGAPLIQFDPRSAQGPSCNFSIPIIDGTVKVDGSPDYNIPSNVYTLILGNMKLATASGHWDSTTTDHGEPFVFRSSDDTKEGCVVIDLPTSKNLTVDIMCPSNASQIPAIDTNISLINASIKELFRSGGVYKNIRYEIARVKSTTPDGAYQLQPKSFRFNAFLPSETPKEEDVGILSLFIQTGDINHGKNNQLFQEWQKLWCETLGCSPVPKDKTASIIFSKEMIYRSTIQPAVKANGYTEVRSDDGYSIKMKIDTQRGVHRDRQNYSFGSSSYSVDAVHVNLPPFELEFIEDDSSRGSAISWKFNYSYSWGLLMTSTSVDMGFHETTHFGKSGSVKGTDEIAKKRHEASLDDRHLVLECSVSSSDWTVTTEVDEPSIWQKIFGATNVTPEWATMKLDLPEFQLTLVNVDFFLTTNLLFPGDKHVINIDQASGLHIPGDFYLVGDVVDK